MNLPHSSFETFCNGLVFGFDVGTGSIGWAVRNGSEFLDVGVLICDSEGSDLSKRRDLRRQRRTLRSRKFRRQWFANELEKLGLGRPQQWLDDPISLRLRALNGNELKPEELHSALVHLFRRRGYTQVPWAKSEKRPDDEGDVLKAVAEVEKEMTETGCEYPCQLLDKRRSAAGNSPIEKWGRKIYWPRELLEKEFRTILNSQKTCFPKLAEKTNWLLFGDTQEVKNHHVFFKTIQNPGVLGLRWPRFDNRGPALDSFQPVDKQGHPQHVVRKSKDAFAKAQWELALMNFRVLDAATRQKCDPRIRFPEFIENLRNEWNKKGKITVARLQRMVEPFRESFLLIEDQKPLTPETGTGRAKYSSPTLEIIRKEIASGNRVDPPQPILSRKGESVNDALNRYFADIKHPLVRHRLTLFSGLLSQLVSRFGQPKMMVLEAVRSLALGQKAKNELNKRNEQFRKERELARKNLGANGESFSRKAIQRYRLWQEAKGRCPFCLQMIERTDLGHGADIEHLVPRNIVDCNEFYNLTIAHLKCNREVKRDQTPFAAFAGNPEQWNNIKDNALKTFSGRKLEIFLSPNAEELIEQKADLQHTAYIARVIRHAALIQLGWLNEHGRDPTPEKQNTALRFQVTNGQLTSRLRKAWGLNQILHPMPEGTRREDLSEEQQKQFSEKNRGDLRHHALDAMVIACTLPWLAHRTHGAKDEFGNVGWWTQDEKQRSKAANPIFPREGQMHEVIKKKIEEIIVRQHVPRGNHGKKLDTTLLSLRLIEDNNKSREVFVARRPLREKSPDAIKDIFSEHLKTYITAEWASWSAENPDWDKENKGPSKGKFPTRFLTQLIDPVWKKPIHRVKFIVEKSRSSVFKVGEHPSGQRRGMYVAYGENSQVNVFARADGRGFVAQPIRPCYPKGQTPQIPQAAGKKLFTIRRGMLFKLNNSFKIGKQELQPEIYRVVALPGEADARISFFPHYQNAAPKGGERLAPMRADIEKLAPHITLLTKNALELPHPAPAQPEPPRPAEA